MTEVLLLLLALGLTPACAVATATVAAEGALRTVRRPAVRLPGSRLGITATSPLDDPLTAPRAAGSRLAAVTGGSGSVLGRVATEDVLDEPAGPAAAV